MRVVAKGAVVSYFADKYNLACMKPIRSLLSVAIAGLLTVSSIHAQTGSPAEPVRYVGGVTVDPTLHEGRFSTPMA